MQRALRLILRGAGYRVLLTGTGRDAIACAARERPQAVIQEVALPDLSGIELCRRLRRRGGMPILVLSEVDNERTKIEALECGADDYVTKPFSAGELLARLAARLRAAPTALRVERNGLVIDLAGHVVRRDGEVIHLTSTEFALLRVLVTSEGTVNYKTLATRVWGRSRGKVARRMRSHIANLRAKLDDGHGESVIQTEIGTGYRFVERQQSRRADRKPKPVTSSL